jgi:DNA repair protein RadC
MEKKSLEKTKLSHFETSQELAEIKISYKSKQKSKIKITNSQDVFNVLFPLFDRDTIEYQEQFFLLLLNRANSVMGWIKLSLGGTSGTVVDPKIVFALALQTNASGIILSHNHPSGNLHPSDNDVALTNKIRNSGKLLEIQLLDHLIISPDEKFYSFADEGNMC